MYSLRAPQRMRWMVVAMERNSETASSLYRQTVNERDRGDFHGRQKSSSFVQSSARLSSIWLESQLFSLSSISTSPSKSATLKGCVSKWSQISWLTTLSASEG